MEKNTETFNESVIILTPAGIVPGLHSCNLSTAEKHQGYYTNLCPTDSNPLKACCNLSTAEDLL